MEVLQIPEVYLFSISLKQHGTNLVASISVGSQISSWAHLGSLLGSHNANIKVLGHLSSYLNALGKN